jgi:hypothetical protein
MYSRIVGHVRAGLVVCMAIVAAAAGTAVAGSGAESSAITKSKVKKIVGKEVAKLAPTLHVASADTARTADTAKSADTASTATSANTANSAQTADTANTAGSAQTAGNADALGGEPAASFGSGVLFGTARFPGGANGAEERTPYGITSNASGIPANPPVSMIFSDFEAIGRGLDGDDSVDIALVSFTGAFTEPLCTVTGPLPACQDAAPFMINDDQRFVLAFSWSNLETSEEVDFAYRLAPAPSGAS